MADVEAPSHGGMETPLTDYLLRARHIMRVPFTPARDHKDLTKPRKWWSLGKVYYVNFGPPPKYLI